MVTTLKVRNGWIISPILYNGCDYLSMLIYVNTKYRVPPHSQATVVKKRRYPLGLYSNGGLKKFTGLLFNDVMRKRNLIPVYRPSGTFTPTYTEVSCSSSGVNRRCDTGESRVGRRHHVLRRCWFTESGKMPFGVGVSAIHVVLYLWEQKPDSCKGRCGLSLHVPGLVGAPVVDAFTVPLHST